MNLSKGVNLSTDVNLSAGFIVKRPGIHSLIQDTGRFGYYNIGLTNGGPIDLEAFQWANRLCANELDATAIEISIGGLKLVAQLDSTIAITGANMPLTINNHKKELWRSHAIKTGDVVELGFTNQGMRSYLAVAGGFIIEKSFGSAATVCREGIGGLTGEPLKTGDVLSCLSQTRKSNLVLPESLRPKYTDDIVLHTVPSYQQKHFSSHQQRMFFSSEYQIGKHFDRMGYRLTGQKISCDIEGILSEGICHGAIQIPADGQPIVLMNDRQTIGGYPKIGAVSSVDTAKLGQLKQGDRVHFEPISMEQAHNYFHLNLNRFNRKQLQQCD